MDDLTNIPEEQRGVRPPSVVIRDPMTGKPRLFYANQFSKYGEGHMESVDNGDPNNLYGEKTVHVAMIYNKSALNSLIHQMKGVKGGPWEMETRDNQIIIHNKRRSKQSISFSYMWHGGKGELLKASFKTEKKTKEVNVIKHSAIDPKTHEVKTTITQTHRGETPNGQGYSVQSTSAALGDNNYFNFRDNIHNYRPHFIPIRKKRFNVLRDTPIPQSRNLVKAQSPETVQANMKKHVNRIISNDEIKQGYKHYEAYFNNLNIKSKVQLQNAWAKFYDVPGYTIKRTITVRTWVNPNTYVKKPITGGNWYGGYTGATGYQSMKSDSTLKFTGNRRNISGHMEYEAIQQKQIEIPVSADQLFSMPLSKDETVNNQNFLENSAMGSSAKEVSCDISVIGNPILETAMVINLENCSRRFSGNWYIESVNHHISQSGYTCEIETVKKDVPMKVSTIHTRMNTQRIYSNINQIAKTSMRSKAYQKASKAVSTIREYYNKGGDKNLYIEQKHGEYLIQYDSKTNLPTTRIK